MRKKSGPKESSAEKHVQAIKEPVFDYFESDPPQVLLYFTDLDVTTFPKEH
jgi:hypothetical protein